jgi:hypothetical protein
MAERFFSVRVIGGTDASYMDIFIFGSAPIFVQAGMSAAGF